MIYFTQEIGDLIEADFAISKFSIFTLDLRFNVANGWPHRFALDIGLHLNAHLTDDQLWLKGVENVFVQHRDGIVDVCYNDPRS